MTVIVIITIILLLALIAWTWANLNGLEKEKKVAFIIISILITGLITLVVFNISKHNIIYEKAQIENTISMTLIPLFTVLNGFIVVQYIARIIGKLKNEEFTKKQVTNRLAITLVIFIVILVFECGYMEDIQTGILNVYFLNK